MHKLGKCAALQAVLEVLQQPSTLSEEQPQSSFQIPLPPAQQRVVDALDKGLNVTVQDDGSATVTNDTVNLLQSLQHEATPVLAFHDNHSDDTLRMYTVAADVIRVVQFGFDRLSSSNSVDISRMVTHVSTAVASGAATPPKRIIGVFAVGTRKPVFTGIATVYARPERTLADALQTRRPDICRAASQATFAAIRKLAACRILANGLVLEDIHLDKKATTAHIQLHHTQRASAGDASDALAMAMVFELAAQASRIGGNAGVSAFIKNVFDVHSTPAWRGKMLRSLPQSVASLGRSKVSLQPGIDQAILAVHEKGIDALDQCVHTFCGHLIQDPDSL